MEIDTAIALMGTQKSLERDQSVSRHVREISPAPEDSPRASVRPSVEQGDISHEDFRRIALLEGSVHDHEGIGPRSPFAADLVLGGAKQPDMLLEGLREDHQLERLPSRSSSVPKPIRWPRLVRVSRRPVSSPPARISRPALPAAASAVVSVNRASSRGNRAQRMTRHIESQQLFLVAQAFALAPIRSLDKLWRIEPRRSIGSDPPKRLSWPTARSLCIEAARSRALSIEAQTDARARMQANRRRHI